MTYDSHIELTDDGWVVLRRCEVEGCETEVVVPRRFCPACRKKRMKQQYKECIERMSVYHKRCRVCMDTLLADGTCRHHCDLTLAAPANRRNRKAVKPDDRISLSVEAMRDAMQKVIPSYTKERARASARVRRHRER